MKNSFYTTLVHLTDDPSTSTHWSRSMNRAFSLGLSALPYYQSQIMEQSVLEEVSNLSRLSVERLNDLEYPSSVRLDSLRHASRNVESLPLPSKIALSCALSSISRFPLSWRALSNVDLKLLKDEDKIHYLLQKFAVKNRLNAGSKLELEFSAMRLVLQEETLPPRYFLKCASPAIVWKSKADVIEEGTHAWFESAGLVKAKSLANSNHFYDRIALSNFYRAHAMIPASFGDANATRQEMRIAKEYAESSAPDNELEESIRLDACKTVHESEIKEHLYVSGDLDSAERSAEDLVAMDPKWPISYHEAAEVSLRQGKLERALKQFEAANNLGPPRLTFSQYMVGACHDNLGNTEEALDAYQKTLLLDDLNISAGIAGFNLARSSGHSTENSFRLRLDSWIEKDLLAEDHLAMIES